MEYESTSSMDERISPYGVIGNRTGLRNQFVKVRILLWTQKTKLLICKIKDYGIQTAI